MPGFASQRMQVAQEHWQLGSDRTLSALLLDYGATVGVVRQGSWWKLSPAPSRNPIKSESAVATSKCR
jgi:hypothetical protein